MPSSGTISLDVAIIGAGPAGAAAALALGGRGLRVGLIEKAELPRHKTCGGGVLRRAIKLLPVSVASLFGGQMPKFWGLFVSHNHTGTLAASQSNLFFKTGVTVTTA